MLVVLISGEDIALRSCHNDTMKEIDLTNPPPSPKKLAEHLKNKLPLWNEVCLMATETGTSLRWMYSEKSGKWSYRADQPGNRYFATLSFNDSGFEVSLNLRSEEWDYIYVDNAQMEAKIADLRANAEKSGDDPAWIHLPVNEQADIPLVARLFAARARRLQPIKTKSGRRK